MTSKGVLQLAALILASEGRTESEAAQIIPQETWDQCFTFGWLENTSHGVPGADPETVTTRSGEESMRAILYALADDVNAPPAPFIEPSDTRSVYGDSWRTFERWPWWAPLAVAGLIAFALILLVLL